MIIIYNCYGGTHSSVLAAAIHLKRLPDDRLPEKKEIENLEYFNKLKYKDMGRLIFHGVDEDGNSIFTIGRGTSKALIPAMRNLILETDKICKIDKGFLFINSSPTVPAIMTVGGFFARGLHIGFIGVPLLLIGAQQAHSKIVELVNKTRQLSKDESKTHMIVDVDNKGKVSYYN